MKKEIIFTDDYSKYVNDSTFVGVLSENLSSKEELIKEYWNKFKCPAGSFSWDSLDEILSDFTWIDAQRILIIHKDIPLLSDRDLKIYIEILLDNSFYVPDRDIESDSIKYDRKVHDGVMVVFPLKFKADIQKILRN